MPMTRMKAPRDATSISIGGEEYKVGKDGYLEIPEILKHHAEAHGYGKAAERSDIDRVAREVVSHLTKDDVDNMGRGDLLIYCDDHRIDVPQRTGLADLRKLVWNDAHEKQKIVAKASKA